MQQGCFVFRKFVHALTKTGKAHSSSQPKPIRGVFVNCWKSNLLTEQGKDRFLIEKGNTCKLSQEQKEHLFDLSTIMPQWCTWKPARSNLTLIRTCNVYSSSWIGLRCHISTMSIKANAFHISRENEEKTIVLFSLSPTFILLFGSASIAFHKRPFNSEEFPLELYISLQKERGLQFIC